MSQIEVTRPWDQLSQRTEFLTLGGIFIWRQIPRMLTVRPRQRFWGRPCRLYDRPSSSTSTITQAGDKTPATPWYGKLKCKCFQICSQKFFSVDMESRIAGGLGLHQNSSGRDGMPRCSSEPLRLKTVVVDARVTSQCFNDRRCRFLSNGIDTWDLS